MSHIPALPNTKGIPLLWPANSIQPTVVKIPPVCIVWDYVFTYHRFFFLSLKKFHSNRYFALKNILSEEEKHASFSHMLMLLIPSSFFYLWTNYSCSIKYLSYSFSIFWNQLENYSPWCYVSQMPEKYHWLAVTADILRTVLMVQFHKS